MHPLALTEQAYPKQLLPGRYRSLRVDENGQAIGLRRHPTHNAQQSQAALHAGLHTGQDRLYGYAARRISLPRSW